MPTKHFDNTKVAAFKECPRKYFFRHVLDWTPKGSETAPALVFGSSWHAGMDTLWGAPKHWSSQELIDAAMDGFTREWSKSYDAKPDLLQQDELGARTPGVAHEMFFQYVCTREKMLKDSEVLAIEKPIAIPMPGSQGVWYVGKLDKVIRYNGIHVLEHKSTTAYATMGNFRWEYLESWNSSPQVKGYEVGAKVYFPGMQDVWMDLALVHKKVHDAFKFMPIMHSRTILEEWVWDTVAWICEIRKEEELYEVRGTLKGGGFRKNEDSCYGKYGTCPFLNICQTCADPSELEGPPEGYEKLKWEPFDTSILELAEKQAKEIGAEEGLIETIKQAGV